MGIAINVEGASKDYDALFHQICSELAEVQAFNKQECLKSDVLQSMANDPEVLALADRLFVATGGKQLASGKEPVERIAKFKQVMTQIKIAKVHGLPVLPNTGAVEFTEADVATVRRAADEVWRHLFRPVSSNLVSDGIGAASAGYLGSEIGRLLADRKVGHNSLRMAMFSGHDNNLLALASLLGVDVEPPEFAAHWMFELHRPAESSSDWTVHAYYVIDPTVMSASEYCSLVPRQLPLDGVYKEFARCPAGAMSADRLIKYLCRPGRGRTARVLHALERRAANMEASKLKREVVVRRARASFSEERQARIRNAFDILSADASDLVGAEELRTMFESIGDEQISHAGVRRLVELFDIESRDKVLGVGPAAAARTNAFDQPEVPTVCSSSDRSRPSA